MIDDPIYWQRVREQAAAMASDGCTGVAQHYQDCCYEHDIAYRTGRTVEGAPVSRREADAMFRRCIQRRSLFGRLSPMAWWRWAGVRVGYPVLQAYERVKAWITHS